MCVPITEQFYYSYFDQFPDIRTIFAKSSCHDLAALSDSGLVSTFSSLFLFLSLIYTLAASSVLTYEKGWIHCIEIILDNVCPNLECTHFGGAVHPHTHPVDPSLVTMTPVTISGY